jgi:hypothetical protein
MTRKIVVGVDGSDGSTKALDWAIAEATRYPAVLELATAWMFPMALGYVFARTPDEVDSRCSGSPRNQCLAWPKSHPMSSSGPPCAKRKLGRRWSN